MEKQTAEQGKKICDCTQLIFVKKGFSGSAAIAGFTMALTVCGVIFYLILQYEQNNIDAVDNLNAKFFLNKQVPTYNTLNYSLIVGAGIICLLSLFAGTLGMNSVLSVCQKCGKKTILK
jgi:hypothetical protein